MLQSVLMARDPKLVARRDLGLGRSWIKVSRSFKKFQDVSRFKLLHEGVSINGGTPIAGWFWLGTIPI